MNGTATHSASRRRVLAVLERPLRARVVEMARRDGVSLSQKVRDLVARAVSLEEDAALEALVRERRSNRAPSIPHARMKRRFGL